ncbi:MAG: CDP-alcohol phosphatidyltransferase family protein [Anaerolineales bacterium]|nr:CDP-alcohol phosphatidyltransferase family protein [Anaerolineales bacterium]
MPSDNPPAAGLVTFTDRMRAQSKGVVEAAARFFIRAGVTPDAMTLLGLMGSTVGAVLLALGAVPPGGIVILLSGLTDALDGTMARLRGKPTRFGAFLDSTMDRYSELFIFGGLAVYFGFASDVLGVAVAFAAAIGSVMVSYTKARAEALGFECKVGLLTRMERYMVLCPLLILNLPFLAAAAVAVLANFTALQRIGHVYRLARDGA